MNESRHDVKRGETPEEPGMSPFGALLLRAMAALYDGLLLVAVLFVLTAAALFANDGKAFGPAWLGVAFGIGWLFFDGFWRHGGQTLGMRAWRLKVVDDGDGTLTRGRTFARYALGFLLFGITYLVVPFDARRRALHDRLTRTRVVRVPRERADD